MYQWLSALVPVLTGEHSLGEPRTLWFLTLRPLTGSRWAASLLVLEVLVVTWVLAVTIARGAEGRGTSGS